MSEPAAATTSHGETAPSAMANRAVALARAGNVADALDLYARALGAVRGEGIPAGLHLALLRDAGPQVVAAFRRVALDGGADISMAYARRGSPIEKALAEYRTLFADGVANTRMLANHARLLSLAGRAEELAALMGMDRLVTIQTVTDAAPDGSGQLLHEALRDWFRANLDRAERLTTRLAAVGTLRFGDLNAIGNDLFLALHRAMTRRVEDYRAGLTDMAGDHPLRRWIPTDFSLEMFAHYSDGTGYHRPHIHSRGWITGVYYVDCEFGPDAGPEDGALHLCPGVGGDPACGGWPDRWLPVRPGMLVFMPSYITHRTLPLGRPAHRLVLPFDVIDLRSTPNAIREAA